MKPSLVVNLCMLVLLQTGCQIPYLLKNAKDQAELLRKRTPIVDVIKDSNSLSPKELEMLKVTLEAKRFSETHLGLKPTDNYSTFVKLDEDYVTYVLSVAPKFELEHFLWSYPFVGDLPYRGYFRKSYALAESEEYIKQGFDTYVRGVAAYSSLGWFEDPIYSSMLRYSEHDLVNVIIHETVHATIYIKGEADFNERLATFIGNVGTAEFYLAREGKESQTYKLIQDENHDDHLFSEFISQKIKSLRKWYDENREQMNNDLRQEQFKAISKEFALDVRPRLRTTKYDYFSTAELNNARLLTFQTYMSDLSDFEKLFAHLDRDFGKLISFCKELEDQSEPEVRLKDYLKQLL